MYKLKIAILIFAFLFSKNASATPIDSAIRNVLRKLANGPVIKDWKNLVGARSIPTGKLRFLVNDFKAVGDGQTVCTQAIQKAIDACSKAGGGTIEFQPGRYVTGSLFIKSNVNFHVGKGVELLGSENEEDWPIIKTRAAGIEMNWRAAMINVRGQRNVSINGEGLLNARGKLWWDKFLTAVSDYERRGLRWAVDYDIQRPHLCQVFECEDVTIQGLTMQDSPFWTVHVVFSKNVTVDHITIRNNVSGKGPSTDGINIDSSAFVVVQNCDVDCNDDNYSFKAGMNADGLRVNIPVQYTIFRNDTARRGKGLITCGSDMTGGIRHVEADNMIGLGTETGIRFKSASVRSGVVEDVFIHHVELENVGKAIEIILNWFPKFSYPTLPTDSTHIPDSWKIIATHIPADKALPHFRDITIADVVATNADKGIVAEGIPAAPAERFHFEHINIQAKSAGFIKYAKDWSFKDTYISGTDGKPVAITDSENVTITKK